MSEALPSGLAGAVVVVTGGGSGIGRAVAVAATRAGAQVLICGRRADALREVAGECGAATLVLDLTAPDGPDQIIDAALRRWGRVDGVVSNAGVMLGGSVTDLSDEHWDISMATNLTAPFRLARAALPALLDRHGALVFVSSVAGLRAPSQAAGYAAAKAGLVMLAQTIAVDYGGRGVRANVVCPGWVTSEMADQEMAEFGEPLGLSPQQSYEEVTRLVPQRRPGSPHEIAAAVTWLLGQHSSYVNGSVLSVDGGSAVVDVGTVGYDFAVRERRG